MANPPSFFSRVTSASVSIRSGVIPASARIIERAMEKQPEWAAPMSSSGFVPFSFSKRVAKE